MTNEERLQKVIFGTQYSSLEYVERFSMCDCLTLGMENTYTAMGAGLEVFLRKFSPGEKYVMPYAGKIPKDQEAQFRPVGYKIPKRIRTFLWSPFHDSTST